MSDDPTPPSSASPLAPPLPTRQRRSLTWSGLHGCADALALAAAVAHSEELLLLVTTDTQTALRLEHEIAFFAGPKCTILPFPDWETLPYDVFSPLPEIVSQRLKTLAELGDHRKGILITSAGTLMQRLAPRNHIVGKTFAIKPGSRIDLAEIRQRLESVGYQCVSQVLQHGDFAVRGSILDLFPMGSHHPYRIELFDDTVESIRTFDTETQRSIERVPAINLFPAREFPFDDAAIKHFRRQFRERFPEAAHHSDIYQDVTKGLAPGGIEYYLPLFVEQTETLFDYLPPGTTIVLHGDVAGAAAAFHEEAVERHRQREGHLDRPPLLPEQLFLDAAELDARITRFRQIGIDPANGSTPTSDTIAFDTPPLPVVALDAKSGEAAAALKAFLQQLSGRVLFVAETAGHREALRETLAKYALRPRLFDGWGAFHAADAPLGLVIAPVEHGLWCRSQGLAVITETQLSGERAQQRRRRRRSSERTFDQLLRDLEDLEIGGPVVHQDYGVGRYQGLQRLTVGGIDGEFLTLEYANQEKVYVPVASLHLIGRYSGAAPESAPLHKLGGDQWQKAKRRALERAKDVAAELLDIYARRAAKAGRGCTLAADEYAAFAAGFPFEETPDQEQAIQDVLRGMCSAEPMDRVICGDVGFGKTEVAMRAAFVAAQNGLQTAVLVPTTLLAQQHFQNFRDRFADTPVRVELLSRFVGRKQQQETIDAVKDGKVDILIGTHKLMQKGIEFKQLGLAIIDEEHRFGVAHKEHFKKLRTELDFLTLTATPIPRTLNMALSGLRDISIIATPPPNRHAIKTFVSEWEDALVQEAILREIKRGGQVYFLHNKIETMEKTAARLEALVPAIRLRIAHGQMPERELEKIMLDFYHQRFNVLMCTTIIESGIDVPSANTIIIDRADLLGLAQLHQLRGRVGRSHHRAYAYLITPPKSAITADALKRLEAIEASGELGAGFVLSTHDLEIRGAGELLGDEQSGQIQEIGFGLYTELLERAVAALKSGKQPELELSHEAGPEIDLQSPALIPDDYLPDVHNRLVLYKRIAGAGSAGELRDLQIEMIDRFGLLPPAAKTLFSVAELKLRARELGIQKIEVGPTGGRILFAPNPNIDPVKIILLIQQPAGKYRLDGPDKLRFNQSFEGPEEKAAYLEELLAKLAA
ncbi:transcription-repair coupling factor [Methylotetracoccus oryzae]|uniref:transcription-repair coupling factor n=1 Tax=Methylotetracoccus oryzae TaxID=1919059 RepID=UPI00111A6907|nr:transcription-repair coupling factor [Methylotetracoccus oryzae]